MENKRYIHRTKQDWQSILDTFNESGLTQDQFCQQYHLASSTFSKWKKQLDKVKTPNTEDFFEIKPSSSFIAPARLVSMFELSVNFRDKIQLNLKIV